MAYDKTILSAVLRQLEVTRSEHQADADARRWQLYERIPRLRAIDRELQSTSARAIRIALDSGGDPEDAIGQLRDRNLALQEEKRSLLLQNGLSPDYLTPAADCPLCADTGYRDGSLCSCVRSKYAAEQTRRLSTILPIETDTFDSFRFDYYSNTVDQRLGSSPRYIMHNNFNLCREFADSFGSKTENLLLFGSSGLGKTFLSACIARVVSERGFSVAYDTSIHIFSHFEEVKFNGANAEQAALSLEKYRSADLLILDDLGTEMGTAFTTSCLYDLLNTRLMKHQPIIINTNLMPNELEKRYSPAVASRILGEFTLLRFLGEDIRRIRQRENRQ
jgi:DNA replication protein DnaC